MNDIMLKKAQGEQQVEQPFMFLGVCFKKMYNFINLLLKLNIYVFS
jgi:hypothetical protein